MRILLAATMAASVLAIGASTVPAAALPLGGEAGNPAAVHKVQQPRGYIDGGREWRGGDRERRGERRGDRGEWRGYRGDRGEWRGRGNGGWRRGRRDFEGRGSFGYRGYRGYRVDCGWLRRRALETGSPYWWRRYRDCRD